MSDKNVVLVRPSYSGVYGLFTAKTKTETVPPVGLAYIAATLRGGTYDGDSIRSGPARKFSPIIIDNELERLTPDQLASKVLSYNPILVGIGAATTSFHQASELADKLNGEVPLALGGPHVTSRGPIALTEGRSFDFAIPREGEYGLLELAEAIDTGGNPSEIRGLYFRSGNQVVSTPERPLIPDLNRLPMQAFDLLNMNEYNHLIAGKGMGQLGAVISSRGCPAGCYFCFNQFGRVIRFRDSDNVLEEIEHLRTKEGAEWLTFYDDTFTWPQKKPAGVEREDFDSLGRIKRISAGMVERGLTMPHQVFVRANLVRESALEAVVRAGGSVASMGLESGNDQILRNVGKGITQERIAGALDTLSRFPEIEVRGSIILGLPGETHETVEQTMQLIETAKIQRVNVNIATPYPGTEMYDMALKGEGLRFLPGAETDWNRFRRHGNCLIEVGDLTPADLIQYQKDAHTRFYTRPDVIEHHFGQMAECLRNDSSLEENAYHFRPPMFALREHFGMEMEEQSPTPVDTRPLTKETLDSWKGTLTEALRASDINNPEARGIITRLNKEFGFN